MACDLVIHNKIQELNCTYLLGQDWVLQFLCDNPVHNLPPYCAWIWILLDCLPVPHDFEHWDQLDHWQSIFSNMFENKDYKYNMHINIFLSIEIFLMLGEIIGLGNKALTK